MGCFKILGIDDDQSFCRLIELSLKNSFGNDVQIEFAYQVDSAMDYLDDTKRHPDLILLDLNMPGKSGIDFIEEYVAKGYHKTNDRIILMSSFIDEHEARQIKQLSTVIDVFDKCDVITELIIHLNSLVNQNTEEIDISTYAPEKITLIDDNKISNTTISKFIEKISPDIQINAFSDEVQAIRHLNAKSKENDLPDVILIDVNMPSLSGFELVELLTESHVFDKKKPQIILYSNSLSLEDERKANRTEAIQHITEKPLSFDEFQSLFKELANR